MDRIPLDAKKREVFGKKVKLLRKDGLLPGHVFGKGVETAHISVPSVVFLKTFAQAGQTGLIDLKVDSEIKPVLIRDVSYDPLTGKPLHVDFYQVNLFEKVKVFVPLVLVGEEPEKVHLGEAIVLQTLNEVEVEALPSDLPEKIEIDQSLLKEIDDAIAVSSLQFDRSKITVSADPEEVVVKLAPAVSAEMEALLEEQAAETAAASTEVTEAEEAAEEAAEEGEVAKAEEEAAEEQKPEE